MTNIRLIEVRSEIGAGTRGASLGIDAIKIASLNAESDYFHQYKSLVVEDENEVLFGNTDKTYAKNISSLKTIYQRMDQSISQVFNEKAFPIILAGDHSCAAGTIASIKRNHSDKKLGVIWIDAHADLHSPYTTPSGNMHGMPLAISLAEDNLDKRNNQIPEEISQSWDDLKKLSGSAPAINYENLVFFGLRDTEMEENHLIKKNNIKSFSVSDVRNHGIERLALETKEYLKDCDLI